MKQSLDAARAVDAAYLAKDRQNEFTTRVKEGFTTIPYRILFT